MAVGRAGVTAPAEGEPVAARGDAQRRSFTLIALSAELDAALAAARSALPTGVQIVQDAGLVAWAKCTR